jgi:8-oxo-dGTP diphosphatase
MRIHVAAAVIRGEDGRILLARRPGHLHQGGLWEFPGGKVEAGETVEAALQRELLEELGIRPTAARPLIQVRHDYPDKQVLLDVWEVSRFAGEPHGAEGQPLAWVGPQQLAGYAFPAANQPIITAALLPDSYLVTPADLPAAQLLDGIARALDAGIALLQLRVPGLEQTGYGQLAQQVMDLCAGRAQVMLKGPLQWLEDFPQAGWHLSSAQLHALAGGGRPLPRGRWLAASCHNAAELALAQQLDVDFVTLSPLLPTATHPGAAALGWEQAAALLRAFNQPAFLLGGLARADLPRAWQCGAQGIAAIRGLWSIG